MYGLVFRRVVVFHGFEHSTACFIHFYRGENVTYHDLESVKVSY